MTATGSGLPMCASLVAQALAPCGMHAESGTGGHAAHAESLVAADDRAAASCHMPDAALGCAAGTGCAAVGAAAASDKPAMPLGAATVDASGWLINLFRSFLAASPAPPPRA